MAYELPKLEYSYSDLEPYIDTETMTVHHSKHHQAYTDKMNAILGSYPQLLEKTPEEIMASLGSSGMSEKDQQAFINHGGGFINHALYWRVMGPEKKIDEELKEKVESTFGSVDALKEQMSEAAATRFGSGWSWLVSDTDGNLSVYSTPNQESPLLKGHTPIICLDVWEHAYYLKYKNKRTEYIENWWNVMKLL